MRLDVRDEFDEVYTGSGRRLAPGARVGLLSRTWPHPVEREIRAIMSHTTNPPGGTGPARVRLIVGMGAGAGGQELRYDVGSRVRFVGSVLRLRAEYLEVDDGAPPPVDVEAWIGGPSGAEGTERLTLWGDELSAAGLASSPFFVAGGGMALVPPGQPEFARVVFSALAEYGVTELRFQRGAKVLARWRPTSPSDLVPVPPDATHVALVPNPSAPEGGRVIFEW